MSEVETASDELLRWFNQVCILLEIPSTSTMNEIYNKIKELKNMVPEVDSTEAPDGYIAVEASIDNCDECAFGGDGACVDDRLCVPQERADRRNVIFKKIKD